MTLIFVATDLHTCADCITNSKAGSDTVSPQMDKMGHKLPQSSDMRGYLERVSHRDGTLRTTEDLPPDRPPLLLLTATAQITSGGGPAILCHHGTLHSSTAPPATWEPIVMSLEARPSFLLPGLLIIVCLFIKYLLQLSAMLRVGPSGRINYLPIIRNCFLGSRDTTSWVRSVPDWSLMIPPLLSPGVTH